MAQVIPVIALALGLELREVRKFFDDQSPEISSGKHAKDHDDKDHDPKGGEEEEEESAKESRIRISSRYVMIGLWGGLAMLVLLGGEQSSIAIVLGRSSYNNLNMESLAIRAALTIAFLSPVAQLILAFMESGFRIKRTPYEKRYRFLSAAIVVMTAVGFLLVYRAY